MLFDPIRLRDLEIRNRVWVAPMCQYSGTEEGVTTDWHLVHLGSRAVGGAGIVMTEASAGFRAFHEGSRACREVDFLLLRRRLAEGAAWGPDLEDEVLAKARERQPATS